MIDIEELQEAKERLKKGYSKFDDFGTTYAVLYSPNQENDLNLIEQAAQELIELREWLSKHLVLSKGNGWQKIDHKKPEDCQGIGLFGVRLNNGKWDTFHGYCAYDEDGWPLKEPEYGDYSAPFEFTDYTHYMPITPPKGESNA